MKSFLCKKNAMYLAFAVLGLGLAVTTHVSAQTTTEEVDSEVVESATSSSDVAEIEEGADETRGDDTVEPINEQANERDADQREDVKQRIEEKRGVIAERTQNRLINLARNMKSKMEAATSRLLQITDRLERRILKLEADGIDITEAKRHTNEARTKLDQAKEILDSIDGEFIRAISSDAPRSQFNEVRKKFIAAREHIREAHTALKNAVRVLKNPNTSPDSPGDDSAQTKPETEESAASNEASE